MTDLMTTFQNRFADWTQSLLEHLQISLLSLLIAIILAVPLAIFISHRKRIAEIILQISGIFQTIPSLALLGLFIPFMGSWNGASRSGSGYLCPFSNFAKYHHWSNNY